MVKPYLHFKFSICHTREEKQNNNKNKPLTETCNEQWCVCLCVNPMQNDLKHSKGNELMDLYIRIKIERLNFNQTFNSAPYTKKKIRSEIEWMVWEDMSIFSMYRCPMWPLHTIFTFFHFSFFLKKKIAREDHPFEIKGRAKERKNCKCIAC